jgi:hypothetical protein
LIIRKKLFVIVGTAFFIAGFYLLIVAQWVYAALSFLIGFWYLVQSVRKVGGGKRYKDYGSSVDDDNSVNDDDTWGDSFDSSDGDSDGGGGGDD